MKVGAESRRALKGRRPTSRNRQSSSAVTVALQGGKGWAEGTYECVGGTGRYATASCSGIYESQSFPSGMAANTARFSLSKLSPCLGMARVLGLFNRS